MHSSCLFPQFCQTYNTFSAKLYLAGRKPVKWQSIVSLIWLSLRFANVQSMEKAVIYNASLNILIRFYYIHFVAYNTRKLWLSNKHYLTIALIFDDIQTNCNDCVQLRLTYFELIVWICLILLINKYTCFCFPVTVCSSCIYIIRSTRAITSEGSNRDSVSEWSDMSTRGHMFQWDSTMQI